MASKNRKRAAQPNNGSDNDDSGPRPKHVRRTSSPSVSNLSPDDRRAELMAEFVKNSRPKERNEGVGMEKVYLFSIRKICR